MDSCIITSSACQKMGGGSKAIVGVFVSLMLFSLIPRVVIE
jgi:hypothetical protein